MKKRIVHYIMTAIILCSFMAHNQTAFAVDGFYSSNDILFYDPNASGCIVSGTGGGKNLVGNDNIEKALRYFVGKDLSLAQAAGIIGNMMVESPGVVAEKEQGGKLVDKNYVPIPGVGFGIVQWTSGGRQKGLVDFAKSTGRDITDLSLQLDYVWKELNSGYKDALSSLKKIDNPVDAAISFEDKYEQSGDSDEKVRTVRGGNAQDIYDSFNKSVPDASTKDTKKAKASDSTKKDKTETIDTTVKTINCTGNGEASAFIDGFAIYNQNDPQWNDKIYSGSTTIGEAGCGPSAMAMIITALTGSKVTPIDTAEYAAKNGIFVEGHGSSHAIASTLSDHWGLSATGIKADVAAINEVLRSNGLILAVANGGAPYTTGGHFIVIRGVTEDGKWMVGDSNGAGGGMENSAQEWDSSSILVNGVDLWAITK